MEILHRTTEEKKLSCLDDFGESLRIKECRPEPGEIDSTEAEPRPILGLGKQKLKVILFLKDLLKNLLETVNTYRNIFLFPYKSHSISV